MCKEGGQWQQALSLLGDIRQIGITQSVISFNVATSVCEKGGHWQRDLSLLDDVPMVGVTQYAISFNIAISACEKRGWWHDPLFLLVKMCGLRYMFVNESF